MQNNSLRGAKGIELLAPAKNLECGIEAINHGADAVYIGAPMFSARAAAGNTIEEIEQLAQYAHQYYAKVYVALNTILKDEELPDVEKLIYQLYEAGADALIIQDMGILGLNLPPIALHASTQMDNRTAKKVDFLEKTGFSQVVLARELGVEEVRNIATQTTVPLEYFIHGALCVSYSGQCYISEALAGRSANRGVCAQYCRLPYTLVDATGKTLSKEKHLLSLKDLNRSAQLKELVDAGVSSFKIEGRLKDVTYVKNITAYYRQLLDGIIGERAASSGKCTFSFTPQTDKSFNRGFTSYNFEQREKEIISPDTPKSIGERVGTVSATRNGAVEIKGAPNMNNGDGFCFKREDGTFDGFRANRIEGRHIYPAERIEIKPGTPLYRNIDQAFEQMLKKKSAERRIEVSFMLTTHEKGFELWAKDEDSNNVSYVIEAPKELAKQDPTANLERIIGKLGDTIFKATAINIDFAGIAYFIPASILTEARRQVIELLIEERLKNRPLEPIHPIIRGLEFPVKELTYLGNVSNKLAKEFYEEAGVISIKPAFELKKAANEPVMFTKHCIKHWLGKCPKEYRGNEKLIEPLFLIHKDTQLRLEFNCKECQMRIYTEKRDR